MIVNNRTPEQLEAEGVLDVKLPDTGSLSAKIKQHPAAVKQDELATEATCTDVSNAAELVRLAGGNIRYVWPWRRWLVWTGSHLAPDDSGHLARYARMVGAGLFDAAAEAPRDAQRQLARWAIASGSAPRIKAMIELAASEDGIAVQPDDLDADPWILTVANGSVDLRSGDLRPHRRADLSTKIAPVPYDPDAHCPRWLQFLAEILPDPETRGFLQRAVGYALTGSTREQALFILHGQGANGKSVLLETLLALVGDYGMRTPSETLLVKRSDGIPSDVAAMRGARLVVASETQDGRRLNESLIKQLSGGDTVSACFKYGEWFTFKPACKLFLATNHKPAIKGGHGIWRRVNLIPFEQRFGDGGLPADPDLLDKLRSELPGILAWAITGAVLWSREGLQAPEVVNAATADYRAEQDTLAAFLDDVCDRGPQLRVTVADLFQAWRVWCDSSVERPGSKKAFTQRLQEAGFQQVRTTHAREWAGLALRG